MSREQLLVAALRRGMEASGHAMTCAAVERFNAWMRSTGSFDMDANEAWTKTFKTQCDCWRKQAREALDAA